MTSEVQTPATKRHDPDTSLEAERDVTASGRRACQQELVARLVSQLPGYTSRELAELTGVDRYLIARRLPECETAGLVQRGGRRYLTDTGRPAVTWWPVSEEAA